MSCAPKTDTCRARVFGWVVEVSVLSAAARLGGLPLGRSGAAFELARPARENTRVRVGSWQVATEQGSAIVVARGRVQGYDAAIRAGIARVEEALDKLSVRGIDDLALANADHEHLAWWPTPAGATLRIVTTWFQTMPTFHVTAEVRDARGRLVRPPRQRSMLWHPSFRFFRLSQTTTDLYDAYRNAYLALESILADRTPQVRRGPGREQEADWFRRALVATGVDLAQFVARKRGREADAIYDRLYRDARVRIFHAKPDRDPLLPRDRRTVASVTHALDLTQRLYLAITEAHLGVVRLRGGFTSYAARTMAQAVFEPLVFVATSDEAPFDGDATAVSAAGAPVVELPHAEPGVYAGFEARRLAWADGADLEGLPFVRRIVGVSANGQPMVQCRLEARLAHQGIDRLEVEFRLLMRNGREFSSRLA